MISKPKGQKSLEHQQKQDGTPLGEAEKRESWGRKQGTNQLERNEERGWRTDFRGAWKKVKEVRKIRQEVDQQQTGKKEQGWLF